MQSRASWRHLYPREFVHRQNTGRVGCPNLGLVGLGSPYALGPVEPSACHVLIVVSTSPQLLLVWLLECLGILHGSWWPQMKAHVFICSNPNHISFWAQLQQRQVGRPLRPSWFCPDLSSALLSSTGTTPKNPRNCLSLWLVTHFSKCSETLHSGGWRYCFSPFPCKSPVSPMWPWRLPSNSLDFSIFSYSSHFTWIVFIRIHSSAAHLNQVFLEAKPKQSACKWSLGIWSGIKYAKNPLWGAEQWERGHSPGVPYSGEELSTWQECDCNSDLGAQW